MGVAAASATYDLPSEQEILRVTEALEAASGRPFDVMTSIKAPFRKFIEPDLVELPL